MREVGIQQRQQVVRRFYKHLQTFFEHLSRWKENGKQGARPNPPYRRKRYSRADWVHTRLSLEQNALKLGTPRGKASICIEWPHPEPRSVQIIHENGGPAICAQYDSEKQDLPDGLIRERLPQGDKVAGVDLGEVYLAVAYDGEDTLLFEGAEVRRLRQIQNQEKEWFASRIDTKKKGSNRFWKLVDAKQRRLKEIRDRIEDVIHKLSTRLVEELWCRGVQTIVIGDLTGIREDMDYGADANRRLHQWAFRQFAEKVEYKAERYGMTVESTREAHTSQTCPQCGTAKKSHKKKRGFSCSSCDFEAHRDQVGAMNIREKYKDPEAWSSGYLKAGRASATCEADSSSPRGSPSGRKTSQLSLFGDEGAAVPTRATPNVRPPERVRYKPHMKCVLADP
jgi:putative transposase